MKLAELKATFLKLSGFVTCWGPEYFVSCEIINETLWLAHVFYKVDETRFPMQINMLILFRFEL